MYGSCVCAKTCGGMGTKFFFFWQNNIIIDANKGFFFRSVKHFPLRFLFFVDVLCSYTIFGKKLEYIPVYFRIYNKLACDMRKDGGRGTKKKTTNSFFEVEDYLNIILTNSS